MAMTNSTRPDDCPPGGPNLLALPCNLAENLDEQKRSKLDALQIEYARDSTLLQSRAYDGILKVISEGSED
jgi:hypothetical protein